MKLLALIFLFLSCSKDFHLKTPLDQSFFMDEMVFTIENQGQKKDDFSLWINEKPKDFIFKKDFQNVYLIAAGPLKERIRAKVCFEKTCLGRELWKAGLPSQMAKGAIKNFNESKKEYEYNWTDSLFLYALAKGRKTLDFGSAQLEKAQEFFKARNRSAAPVTTPDLAPISLGALLFKEENFPVNKILQKTYAFLKKEPRNELGALNHVGRKHKFASWLPKTRFFVKDSIWLDSLVMYTLPARLLGEEFNDENLIEFSGKQHEIFQEKLKASNGLYKHAFFLKEKTVSPEGEFYWLRGNAWVALSLIEMLAVEKDGKKRDFYQKSLQELLKALLPFQKENGLFDTLLTPNEISNYEDLSGNCIIAYTLVKAMNKNIIGAQFKKETKKLVNGIFHNAIKEGKGISLANISGPTNAFSHYWYYTKLVGRDKNLGYGVGPFILLLSELKRQ